MALEMAHSGREVIPSWSFLWHGFLLVLSCVHTFSTQSRLEQKKIMGKSRKLPYIRNLDQEFLI